MELAHLSRAHHGTDEDHALTGTVELDLGDALVPTVLDLADRSGLGESREVLGHWLQRQPEAFTVYGRPDDHEPVSFLARLRLNAPEEGDLEADPIVAAAWRQVAGDASWTPGEEIAVARFLASDPPVEVLSPMDPRLVRSHSEIARASRRLAVTYVALPVGSPWESCMPGLDHHPSEDTAPVGVGDREWQLSATTGGRSPSAATSPGCSPAPHSRSNRPGRCTTGRARSSTRRCASCCGTGATTTPWRPTR